MFASMSSRRSQARRAARVLHEQPAQVASEELRNLIASVQELVERLGAAADPEVKRLRNRAEVALDNAREALGQGSSQLGQRARDLAEQGHAYVRRRPVASLGLVALGMLAIGLWASRSMTSD